MNAGSDCLGIPEHPSATASMLARLPDGVLLFLLPNPPAPDYDPCQLGELSDGRWGWVKKEFLER